ncbi:hypothetical protein WG936_05460 [Corynebacterium sp. H127]|uniref:hypothetical protein n=1 Tax=Corynebacterium sp. H127 TaxID=3133418 RepID=UPI0030A2D254
MIVKSPNTEFSGTVGKDTFVAGICEKPTEMEYYRTAGYVIEEDQAADEDTTAESDDQGIEPPQDQPPVRPPRSAKKSLLELYATIVGVDVEGMTADQINHALDEHEAAATDAE